MPERQHVVDTITAHMRTVLVEAADQDLPETRDLRDFAQFDSLAVLETLVWLETTFDISIVDDDLVADRFASISTMADYVIERRA